MMPTNEPYNLCHGDSNPTWGGDSDPSTHRTVSIFPGKLVVPLRHPWFPNASPAWEIWVRGRASLDPERTLSARRPKLSDPPPPGGIQGEPAS